MNMFLMMKIHELDKLDSDGIEDNTEYTSWYWSESSIALQDSVQGGVYMSLLGW